MFVLPRVLRFIHRTGLTAGLVPLLKFFTEIQGPIACHAAAVLIPVLDEDDAVRMSRAAAERPWLGQAIECVDAPLLRRMVELAPDAWADALTSVLSSSPIPLAELLIPFLDGLPITFKRRVLLTWAASAGASELPWVWEGDYRIATARPADRVHQLLFDHGFEREAVAATSETVEGSPPGHPPSWSG